MILAPRAKKWPRLLKDSGKKESADDREYFTQFPGDFPGPPILKH